MQNIWQSRSLLMYVHSTLTAAHSCGRLWNRKLAECVTTSYASRALIPFVKPPSPSPGKSAGTDKKLFKQLETRYSMDLSVSQSSISPEDHFHMGSPFGPMDQASSRKTLFYLISTLNASFPDYDFRYVVNHREQTRCHKK